MSLLEEIQKFLKIKPRKDVQTAQEVKVPLPLTNPPPMQEQSPPRNPKKKKNRHGIPVLTETAENIFKNMEAAGPEVLVQNKKQYQPSLPPAPSSTRKKEKKQHTASGKIPKLSTDLDFLHAMTRTRAQEQDPRNKLPSHTLKKKPALPHQPRPLLKDKNGIPILKDQTDFTRVFKATEKIPTEQMSAAKTPDRENPKFPALLGKALGEKGQDRLLREKKAGLEASPGIRLSERIRRYPEPQRYLDLHGFSGIQARLKTEFFIEQALQDGLFTIRIITGRGLHSEGPAVLPDIVDQKIREMEETGSVLSWKWESGHPEPEGSVRIYLKHFP